MNKYILSFALIAAGTVAASADVIVAFPNGENGKKYVVEHMLISDMVKPRGERPANPVADTLTVTNNAIVIPVEPKGDARYIISTGDRSAIQFFTSPKDELLVKVSYMNPLTYSVEGSALMDGITSLKPREEELMAEYMSANAARDEGSIEAVINAYNKFFADYIDKNPTSPASAYALSRLEGEEFLKNYQKLEPNLTNNLFYPILVKMKESAERSVAAEKKMQALQNGETPAPNFTLKNLEGKDVSLSDFRGKWVVIDFWGSWCGWCIKGMPKLKDAYEQYAPELEVIGVDCNESQEAWRKGVEKYQLPWVNVYNPEGSTLLADYVVQGFPTKVIVSPEGKIANIIVGEDPAFYDILARLINGK